MVPLEGSMDVTEPEMLMYWTFEKSENCPLPISLVVCKQRKITDRKKNHRDAFVKI